MMRRLCGLILAAGLLLGAAPEPAEEGRDPFFPAFTTSSSYHLPLFQILRGERIVIPVTPQNAGGDITVPGMFVDGDTDTGITATGTSDELAIVSGQALLPQYRRDYRFGRRGFLNGRSLFADLGQGTNGTQIWCLDCNEAAPCAGGGSGALAVRSGAAWNCSALAGGGGGAISGTANTIAKFNATGDDVEDSQITDDGTDILVAPSGDISINPVGDFFINAKDLVVLGAGNDGIFAPISDTTFELQGNIVGSGAYGTIFSFMTDMSAPGDFRTGLDISLSNGFLTQGTLEGLTIEFSSSTAATERGLVFASSQRFDNFMVIRDASFNTLFDYVTPTAERTITYPDASGTVPLVTGTPLPAYGEIHISTPAGTTTTSGTPLKALGTTTLGNAAQFDMPANNRLRYTGATTTVFTCSVNVSLESDAGGVLFSMFLADNGVPDATSEIDRQIVILAEHGSAGTGFIVELAQNEHVELWIDTDAGNPTITIDHMTLRCSKVN